MKLKYEFVINNVAGSQVAVPVGRNSGDFKGYIRLNDSGVYIFNLLKNDISRDEIIKKITADFPESSQSEVDATVDEFLEKLRNAKLI